MLLLAALVLAGTDERLWLGFAPKYLENLGAAPLQTTVPARLGFGTNKRWRSPSNQF
jgi:hypothetical protein